MTFFLTIFACIALFLLFDLLIRKATPRRLLMILLGSVIGSFLSLLLLILYQILSSPFAIPKNYHLLLESLLLLLGFSLGIRGVEKLLSCYPSLFIPMKQSRSLAEPSLSQVERQKGDFLKIKIQRPGKEEKQGVGYLEDGAMVVVNGGGDFIGEMVPVRVVSVKQSSSGRMIFCNLIEETL